MNFHCTWGLPHRHHHRSTWTTCVARAEDVVLLLQKVMQKSKTATDGTTVERLRKMPRVAAPREEEMSIEETATGIWADEDPESVQLQQYFEDTSARRLWHAAMKGDRALLGITGKSLRRLMVSDTVSTEIPKFCKSYSHVCWLYYSPFVWLHLILTYFGNRYIYNII